MTQEEFIQMANGTRAKAVSVAERFGYSQDDAEDVALDVMLRLWSLHEQLHDANHLKASVTITARRVRIPPNDQPRPVPPGRRTDPGHPLARRTVVSGNSTITELEKIRFADVRK